MKWSIKKVQIENELDKKDIKCKIFRKKYLSFMRRINTCSNLLYVYNYSWENMCYSLPNSQAHEIIVDLKENHFAEWSMLTGATGNDPYNSFPNVGDFLS